MISNLIILFLFLLIVALIIYLFQMRRGLEKQVMALQQIRRGNNVNIRFRDSAPALHALCYELNQLMNQVQEITAHAKQLEEERKQMISNISHDLRTPLTSLLGYVEVILADNTLSQEEKNNYLRIVAERGKNLSQLIDQFFELAKIETEESIQVEKVDIVSFVKEIAVSYYYEFEKVKVQPKLNLPDKPLHMLIDLRLFRRIIENLLNNAIRYGSSGGMIGISLWEEEGMVCLEVWDNGIGIPAEDLPHLCDRFYTGKQARTHGSQGSGLGLTIVQKLVQKHRGELLITSIPHERTSFICRLIK